MARGPGTRTLAAARLPAVRPSIPPPPRLRMKAGMPALSRRPLTISASITLLATHTTTGSWSNPPPVVADAPVSARLGGFLVGAIFSFVPTWQSIRQCAHGSRASHLGRTCPPLCGRTTMRVGGISGLGAWEWYHFHDGVEVERPIDVGKIMPVGQFPPDLRCHPGRVNYQDYILIRVISIKRVCHRQETIGLRRAVDEAFSRQCRRRIVAPRLPASPGCAGHHVIDGRQPPVAFSATSPGTVQRNEAQLSRHVRGRSTFANALVAEKLCCVRRNVVRHDRTTHCSRPAASATVRGCCAGVSARLLPAGRSAQCYL